MCQTCGGAGLSVDKCPSEEAVLAFEDKCSLEQAVLAFEVLPPEEDAAVDAEAYVGPEQPEAMYSDHSVVSVGSGELARQSQEKSFIHDSDASSTMFTSDDSFVGYRECDQRVRVAGKLVLPIVGHGDVTISFR